MIAPAAVGRKRMLAGIRRPEIIREILNVAALAHWFNDEIAAGEIQHLARE